jgi:hypothetical protein
MSRLTACTVVVVALIAADVVVNVFETSDRKGWDWAVTVTTVVWFALLAFHKEREAS